MKYLMKPGRCANGAQRDAGTLIHAVETDDEWGSYHAALCGTQPGRRTPGWSNEPAHDHATCPRCLKKLQAQANEANESMADHRDNINRAREQMDGLRRGMGLE